MIQFFRFDLKVEFVFFKETVPKINHAWNFSSEEDAEIKGFIESQDVQLLNEIAEVLEWE